MGLAAAGFPRLAGLPAGYLSKQLEDFRSGSRTSPVMQPLAKALAEDEIRAVTQTLAAMPAPATPAISRSATPNSLGERLALRGAWDRQVPECVTCHGPGGVGVGQTFPPLAGQSAAYLSAQLNAWRDGTRRNDPDDLMGHIAKSLSAEEVTAVADYFSKVNSQESRP
ncbi:cytochrome c family protein [Pseudomonas sp. CF161]|nr:cytochrome c family protein [Pseudomonas sp. CF161]